MRKSKDCTGVCLAPSQLTDAFSGYYFITSPSKLSTQNCQQDCICTFRDGFTFVFYHTWKATHILLHFSIKLNDRKCSNLISEDTIFLNYVLKPEGSVNLRKTNS